MDEILPGSQSAIVCFSLEVKADVEVQSSVVERHIPWKPYMSSVCLTSR